MAKRRKRKWIVLAAVVLAVVYFASTRISAPTVADGSYLLTDIGGAYAEGRPDGLLSRVLEERAGLIELLANLDKAAHDDRIAGVVVRMATLDAGWAQIREIRDALTGVQASGKTVVAHMGAEVMGGNREYYLASVADQVFVAPAASPMLNGLSAHYYFLGGVWDKINVAVDVEQIREFKTFGDMLSRRSMSAAHREMADSILDDINTEFLGAIAASRDLSLDEMRSVIDSCPSSASDFVEAGLADGTMFFDEISDFLSEDRSAPFVEASDYANVPAQSLGLGGGPKVAMIHAVGTIVPGKGGRRSAFGVTVGSRTLSDAFQSAADDPDIRAIVFRVDSPGGSASASDAVWQSVRLAREHKPVIASLGNVAASGGYYMAAGADHIVADPVSITGSIGVVLFKPNLGGVYDWMGMGTESLSRGRYARIFDTARGLEPSEIALLRTQMEGVYRRFLDRVAEGRSMTVEEVDRVGGGRVWTGHQALEAGLVDEIGGLHAAIDAAAAEAGISEPDTVEVIYLPKAGGFIEQLAGLPSAQAARALPAVVTRPLESLGIYGSLEVGIHAITAGALSIR